MTSDPIFSFSILDFHVICQCYIHQCYMSNMEDRCDVLNMEDHRHVLNMED